VRGAARPSFHPVFWRRSAGAGLLAPVFWRRSSGAGLLAPVFWRPPFLPHREGRSTWQ
jgi:hypothetical protein